MSYHPELPLKPHGRRLETFNSVGG